MKFGQFVKLQKKKFYQKILQKLWPENWIQALLCWQRINHNFHCKKELLKQAT